MSLYDIDPGLIAAADQRMHAIGADLDTCIQSYRIHRGQTDATVAFVALANNMLDCLGHEEACEVLALAVHRLAEGVDAIAKERERGAAALGPVLLAHGRTDIRGCQCGWAELGRSHVTHVVQAWLDAIAKEDDCA